MKDSRTISGDELPAGALEALEDTRTHLINSVIEAFDNEMKKKGKCLNPNDKPYIHDRLVQRMILQLTMTAKLETGMLTDMGIMLSDLNQSKLEEYGV